VLVQLTQEAFRQLIRVQPTSHLIPLLLCLLVLVPSAAVGCGWLARSRASAVIGGLAGSALAVAITLTLFRGGFGHESLSRLHTCTVTDPLVLSADGLANLALFAPTAFLAVLAIGRPGRVSLGIASVSLAVEGLQAVEWLGVCDSSDAVHNAVGGLVAALVAVAARAAWFRRHPAVSGSSACPRSC
jgi:glycopeptide antibiotics resistance protein